MSAEFEQEVMRSLGGLETGLADLKKQLLDNGQPGFISETRKRLAELEKGDYRRTLIERGVAGVIATVVSVGIALADKWHK